MPSVSSRAVNASGRPTRSVAAILLLAVSMFAQAGGPAGHWEGAVQTPNGELKFEIDLAQQLLQGPDGSRFTFAINPYRKQALLRGLDDIGITEQYADDITAFEATRPDFLPRIGA